MKAGYYTEGQIPAQQIHEDAGFIGEDIGILRDKTLIAG